ncbi:WD-40 repeat protein [Calothrix sp. NIES-4071]|nr:WD-40 repeat protein [Calothrix sp. NIES-4071]BAZ63535.1 WD-40 repeat protein [Calothrix sp. NIES-4105]
MNWTSLLKSQQVDFLTRVKKPKTYEVSLLESSVKGCHSEIMAFKGEALTKLLQKARQQAELAAKNPPPVPPEYPEPPDWTIPFPNYFKEQALYYLLREQIVERVMHERLGKLVKKVPHDVLTSIALDDEGNLRSESKFSYALTSNPRFSIQVYVADGESFNGIKKDKIKWTVTQDDLKNHQLLIFLCLFYPSTGKHGDEKQVVMAGFLPTELIESGEPKITVVPSKLLYAGGLNWYLDSFTIKDEQAESDEIMLVETVQVASHSLRDYACEWEYWQTLRGHTRGINCLAFTAAKDMAPLLATGSLGEIKLWDLNKGELVCTFSEQPWSKSGLVDEINALAFSSDGQIIVSGGADSTIKIWHVGARDLIDILHKHNGMVRGVACSPDNRMIFTGGDDRRVLYWDLRLRQVYSSLSLDDTAAHALVLSRDGKILVTGSYRKIKVWRLLGEETRLESSFSAHSHVVSCLCLSCDNKVLISGSRDHSIKVWSLAGELVRVLKGHSDGVCAVALSPDGKILASGSVDKTIKLWDLHSGEMLATFIGHADAVTGLTFTASGEILISASLDKTIKIWQRGL